MATDSTPTMVGFSWSSMPVEAPAIPGDDGWCVRDAVCRLLGWERDSEEGRAFISWPEWTDVIKLAVRLGLTVFEIAAPGVWDELARRAAHPGVAWFGFPNGKSHAEYVPDVRWLLRYWPTPNGHRCTQPPCNTGWPLGPEHMKHRPVLGVVLVDEGQTPHEL